MKNELKNNIKSDSLQMSRLEEENKVLKNALELLTIKNFRVFRGYFKTLEKPDTWNCSFSTVLLDIELMFIFHKLFQLHIFDYIVNRQNPFNKTDKDTIFLAKLCNTWANNIAVNVIHEQDFSPVEFKSKFKRFTSHHVELWNGKT